MNSNDDLFLKDPFRKIWSKNFHENLRSREFEKENRTSIFHLSKKIVRSNLHPSAILVNPGPSLEKNINELKKLSKEKASLIMCSDVCLYRLLDEGITPDIVCTIDPSDTIERFWQGYEEKTKEITLFAPTTVSTLSLKRWRGKVIFFNQRDRTKVKDDFFQRLTKHVKIFGGFLNLNFVGATMIQTCALLRIESIFLVGWDFASDEEKNFYCKGFLEKRIFTTLKDDENLEAELEKRKDEFEGEEGQTIKKMLQKDFKRGLEAYLNLLTKRSVDESLEIPVEHVETKKKLYTNRSFMLYKKILLDIILKEIKIPIFNCTEGGILTEINQLSLKECRKFLSKSSSEEFLKTIFS